MHIFSKALLCAAALMLAPAALAMTASQTVEVERVVQNPDGTETLIREPADNVTPGARVVYTVAYTNDEAEARTDLVFTMPVPGELTYVEGSADLPGTDVAVSVDGGASFGPRGAATVVEDGTPRRAEARDITHIRWTIAGPVAPGTTDAVSFKGVLN